MHGKVLGSLKKKYEKPDLKKYSTLTHITLHTNPAWFDPGWGPCPNPARGGSCVYGFRRSIGLGKE